MLINVNASSTNNDQTYLKHRRQEVAEICNSNGHIIARNAF
jgi:hypothetical protein